jgi:predicted deacylase
MANADLRVGQLVARPGDKVFGTVEVDAGGHVVELPVFLINGQAAGPTLAITGGIHAAEYASIAAALDTGQTLDPQALAGRAIIVPVVNVPGFSARSIYVCPLDGKNLNRFFPGNAAGSPTEQLASWVFQNVISQASYFMDLHGGDLIEALVPFTLFYRTGNADVDRRSQELAQVFGIPIIVGSETAGSTYSAAARAGIPALLAEAGGQGIWPREDVGLLRDGVSRVMRHLGMLAGPAPVPVATRLLERFLWLFSEHTAFWYPGIGVGEDVRTGQVLGHVRDYEGHVLQTALAPADGQVLFLVSSLAINVRDPLLAIGA